jgi:hypothetical protein
MLVRCFLNAVKQFPSLARPRRRARLERHEPLAKACKSRSCLFMALFGPSSVSELSP